MDSYPEDTDRRQGITKVVEMGIAAVPGVGGPLQIAFQEAAGRRLIERRTQWLNDLAEKVHRLESHIGDFDHLLDQDTFMDAVTTASQIADRTSRAGKLKPNVMMGGKSVIIEAGMPELASRKDLIDRYAAALSNAGLIAQSLSGLMSEAGLWAAATTPLAADFLAFVADPQGDAAG